MFHLDNFKMPFIIIKNKKGQYNKCSFVVSV